MMWFCGDTHGDLLHVVEHVRHAREAGQGPAAIILLGDIDAPRPLHLELAEIAGMTEIFWIPGNHDSDDNLSWNNLVCSELAHANLHCRIGQIGPWRVAGLGGIFRRSVWAPPAQPLFPSYKDWRADLLERRPPKDFGLAESAEERRHLTTIFPNCIAALTQQRGDILVSHEAPECRDDGRGWQEIGDVARSLGVRFAFHGHHHDCPDYSGCFPCLGFEVHAVGFRGIKALGGEGRVTVIRPGDYDAAGSVRWEEGDE
jgi:hypothetical protein